MAERNIDTDHDSAPNDRGVLPAFTRNEGCGEADGVVSYCLEGKNQIKRDLTRKGPALAADDELDTVSFKIK